MFIKPFTQKISFLILRLCDLKKERKKNEKKDFFKNLRDFFNFKQGLAVWKVAARFRLAPTGFGPSLPRPASALPQWLARPDAGCLAG